MDVPIYFLMVKEIEQCSGPPGTVRPVSQQGAVTTEVMQEGVVPPRHELIRARRLQLEVLGAACLPDVRPSVAGSWEEPEAPGGKVWSGGAEGPLEWDAVALCQLRWKDFSLWKTGRLSGTSIPEGPDGVTAKQ